MLPAEDIVARYIPQFDEPVSPYLGPEAGLPTKGDSQSGSGSGGDISIGTLFDDDEESNNNDNNDVGLVVPSFMTCPNNNELCCNGSTKNCNLRVNEMMFGMVHNAMSSEGEF